MRYLTVQYVRKPDGQTDEGIAVCNRLRDREIQMSAVIIDFQDRKIIKASLQGTTIPKDFDRIVSFYHKHYKHVIDRLLKENGLEYVGEEKQNDATADPAASTDTQPGPSVA